MGRGLTSRNGAPRGRMCLCATSCLCGMTPPRRHAGPVYPLREDMFGNRILLLIPHPDDEVAGCCAAVGRARGARCRVFGLFLTDGVPDKRSLWPWQRGECVAQEPWREVGGYKYFYMDWKLDVYRCDSWHTKMGSVWESGEVALIRDGCTACMSDCYRDASVLLHFAVSVGDAIQHIKRWDFVDALMAVSASSSRRSIGALAEGSATPSKLASLGGWFGGPPSMRP